MKKGIVLVFFLVSLFSVFASSYYSPSVQGYSECSFTFPTAEYLKIKPNKSESIVLGFDVMAADFCINKVEVGAGFSFVHNSRSVIFENQFLRAYSGMGFVLGTKYHFDDFFSLGLKLRYLFCRYYPLKNRFDIAEAEIDPEIGIIRSNSIKAGIIMPVTLTYKSDSLSLKVGLGFDFQYRLRIGKQYEEK